MKSETIAKQFGEKEGFDFVLFYKKWNGYDAYQTGKTKHIGAIIGYPFYILVDGDGKPRIAEPQEVWDLLGDA